MFILSQSFTFDAAHTLKRNVPLVEYTPSMRIHGHTYTAKVSICGEKGNSGMIESGGRKPKTHDLFYLREAISLVRSKLDHHFLDEVEGLGTPTLENLCEFIASNLSGWPVESVEVSRSGGDSCKWIGGNV